LVLDRLDQRRAGVAREGAFAGDFEDAMADVSVLGEVRVGRIVEFNPSIDRATLGEIRVELRAELAITAGARVTVLDLTVVRVHVVAGEG